MVGSSAFLIAAVVASTAVSVVGALSSADAQRRAANQNADAHEQAAIAARKKAEFEEQRHRLGVQKLISTQRSLWGKSGLAMEGTPLLTIEDTVVQGELDALAIRYGGDIAAAQARSAANLSRMRGADAQTAGYFAAGSSLLSGATKVAGLTKPGVGVSKIDPDMSMW